jgi:hypothetical protein
MVSWGGVGARLGGAAAGCGSWGCPSEGASEAAAEAKGAQPAPWAGVEMGAMV